jgi:glutaconate CoA-transferase, subunit B
VTLAPTPAEVMIAAAAREIRDGEVVFVGMRLPLLAFALAKRTHAPSAVGLFENGIIRETPSSAMLHTMGDTPNIEGARMCCRMTTVMGLLQRGDVDLGFLGGAEVDRFGNINTSYIGDPKKPDVKLPGSGGAADIASLAKRYVVVIDHAPRRLPRRVGYVTSPGYGDGPGWRSRVGLPRGGPSAIITDRATLRFDPSSGEAYLASVHAGFTAVEVVAQTGWDVQIGPECSTTTPPTAEELSIVRDCDPEGFWTGRRG